MNKTATPGSEEKAAGLATPRPWHIVKCGSPEQLHYAHGVACVGDYFIESKSGGGSDREDAALIVKAVNNFESFVALAELCVGSSDPVVSMAAHETLRSLNKAQ